MARIAPEVQGVTQEGQSLELPGRGGDAFDTEYLKGDLTSRSVKGGAATVSAQGVRFLLRLVSVAVLARLLTPQDFGLVAMVTAVTNFIMMFKDMGLSSATIQRPQINQAQVSTLFWVNAVIGVVFAILTCLLAPVVSWFYGEPRLVGITVGLAAAFVFAGLTVQHQALLRRQMRFVALGTVDVAAMLLGTCAGIIAAVWGARYWSLVIGQVVMAASGAAGAWLASGWHPGWPSRGAGVRPMVLFGRNVSGFHFVNYFARNLDNILLGRFWGPHILGLYSRAYGLLMLPISQLTSPLGSVAMPALSRLQDDPEKYAKYYGRFVLLLSFLSMPLVALLAACSENTIRLFLGEKWVGASRIFQVLALTSFIQPISATMGTVLLSLGQSGRLFKVGLFNSCIIVLSFVIGIRWGALGVACAYCAANYLTLFPSLWYSCRRAPVSVTDFLQAISRPAIASLIMATVVLGIRSLVRDQHDVVIMVVCSLGGLGIYMLAWILLPGGRQTLREMRGYAARMFPAKSRD